jgi:L-threonylcarbamoyladenylate synthase
VKLLRASNESVKLAAEIIRSGGLVVVPTETVYGLAANALDKLAVAKIFSAKGRPAEHPLISHVFGLSQVPSVVGRWPETAQSLAEAFWPGPLSLVLPKAEQMPMVTTGGRATAAVRMPSQEILRNIIEAAGVPIAAPSANPFTGISPTRVEHLDQAIIEAADLVIDGGQCRIGIESTVVDLSEGEPRLLRPGSITAAQLEEILGRKLNWGDRTRAPGSFAKHYSPKATVRLIEQMGDRPGLVYSKPALANQLSMPQNASEYAFALYGALHQMDNLGLSDFWIEKPPSGPEWDAVLDRLLRAAS